MWLLAGVGGLVAGAIHFAITPDHFAEAAGQGLFFLTLGTVQVGWAMWHLARPSMTAWLAGIAIALASILTYVLSLFLAAPFSAGVESVDYLALFTKAIEAATMLVLLVPPIAAARVLGRSRGKMVVTLVFAMTIGLAGAGAAYGIGYGLEIVAPSLSEPSEHHHGEGEEHEASASDPAGIHVLDNVDPLIRRP
jgi:hypothetical protein